MSQKLLKIILLTLLTTGLVFLGILLVRNKNKKDATEILTNIENPFGVGGEDTSVDRGGGQSNGGGTPQEVDENGNPIQANFITNEDNPVLVKISEEPSAGGTFYSAEREIILPEASSENLIEGYDFTGYPTLKFGDDRKEVSDLKTVLNRQDPTPGLDINNAFDTALKTAVVDFQTRNNLKPDGVVGAGTYKALNDFQGIKPKPKTQNPKEMVNYVRFVERGTGYVFDKPINKNEPKSLVTNKNISKVYEVYFNDTASKILMRYLKGSTVENIIGSITIPDVVSLPGVKKIGDLETKLLSNSITFVSLLPSSQKAFYLMKESGGVSGVVYDFKTSQSKKVWTSSFSEWIPQAVSENTISLTTAASGLIPGNSYILDVKNNSLKNVLTNINGLTTNISRDGKKMIYSYYENGNLKTSLMDMQTGRISDFSPITLSEKCVWSFDNKTVYCGAPISVSPGLYPDDWYKGEILFNDVLWKVDVDTNTANIVLNQNQIPNQIDVTNPQINKEGNYMIFVNKHDLILYGVDLSRI
jgi:peptidoglycan hydrolase-like protein with peptidoglycan-binding domain